MLSSFFHRDQHIKDKSGEDALYYLVYQRYLIVYSIIITVLSVSILLPLNIYSRPNSNIHIKLILLL